MLFNFVQVQKKRLHTHSVYDSNSKKVLLAKSNYLASLKKLSLRHLVRYLDMFQKSKMFHKISINNIEDNYKGFLQENTKDFLVFDLNFLVLGKNPEEYFMLNHFVLNDFFNKVKNLNSKGNVLGINTNTEQNVFFNFFHNIKNQLNFNVFNYFICRDLWDVKKESNITFQHFYLKVNYGWFFYNTKHPFHLVAPSPWPFVLSIFVLIFFMGFVTFMREGQHLGMIIGLGGILYVIIEWCKDVIEEGVFFGEHTKKVSKGLRLGFKLFIISEIMFFVAFFWAFFASSLSPSIFIGGVWPPVSFIVNFMVPDSTSWTSVPWLNTVFLVSSGFTVTWLHYLVKKKEWLLNYTNRIVKYLCVKSLSLVSIKYETRKLVVLVFLNPKRYWKFYISLFFFLTLLLALIFIDSQLQEYLHLPFSFRDSIYGSCFYILTGFHGFHVFIGTVFIYVCWYRFVLNQITRRNHVGLESAIWYWHFVDVVWLGLYYSLYRWSEAGIPAFWGFYYTINSTIYLDTLDVLFYGLI